jgi:hypothetical protein
MPTHSSLTGAELHENKGVAGAANNTVASATSSATVWRKVNADMIDTSSVLNTNLVVFQAELTDVSTAETVFIPIPFNCTVENVYAVLQGTITVADATVTLKNTSGSTMDTITVLYTGSSAGTTFNVSPVSNNTFTAGQRMSIETDGGSTGTQKLFITVVAEMT